MCRWHQSAERTFEEAKEDIVAAYVFRHRQELYNQLADERLEATGFVFYATRVREDLTQPL